MMRASDTDAELLRLSVTSIVKVLEPAFTGVPYQTPDALKISPVLQAPLHAGSDQVYGGLPPTALIVRP